MVGIALAYSVPDVCECHCAKQGGGNTANFSPSMAYKNTTLEHRSSLRKQKVNDESADATEATPVKVSDVLKQSSYVHLHTRAMTVFAKGKKMCVGGGHCSLYHR